MTFAGCNTELPSDQNLCDFFLGGEVDPVGEEYDSSGAKIAGQSGESDEREFKPEKEAQRLRKMGQDTVKALIHGLIEESMKGNGRMVKNGTELKQTKTETSLVSMLME